MNIDEIEKLLFEERDSKFCDMQIKIIPNVKPETIIGVKTPVLRVLAKKIYKSGDAKQFMEKLPHKYFEENQLHAFIISQMKDFDECINEAERFLPFVDNWATCDQMTPESFKKNRKKLLDYINKWLKSSGEYTVRFGIKMLMTHFLDEDFDISYAQKVAEVISDAYYINMMRAWYFATALAKQYEAVIPFIEEKKLDVWTHNKSIQKSVESYRISDERKAYLKTLKIKSR
ncbi:MAG: DNA alkylation repair protein [Lachnospiraceae bacterium]|nr:DNA alkylation repair protein [Lachnospiraceae bacterium]